MLHGRKLTISMNKINVLYTGRGNQVLKATQSNLNPGALPLFHLRQQLQHDDKLWISHVILGDENAEGWTTAKTPEPADKLEFGPDIVG